MKQSIKLGFLAAAMIGVWGTASAQTMTDVELVNPADSPYVLDPRGVIVRDPFGLCWRTGYWSVDAASKAAIKNAKYPNWTAICECEDKALWVKPVCEPPPPPPPPPAPPPPPPPPAAPAPTSEKVTFAADALFDFDKAVLRPDGKAKLDELVSKMAGVSLEVIIGVGYTDRLGSLAHNQKLSVARAQAVKDYLVSKGIEPNRVYTEGKGPANPVKQCADPSAKGEIRNFKQLVECLQPNRRVEVEVVGTRPVKR